MDKTVRKILDDNLCISCGACAAICPQKSIVLTKNKYILIPEIHDSCVNCGLCMKVCPSAKMDIYDNSQSVESFILGSYKKIMCAQALDEELLSSCTSGGVVTQMCTALLYKELYDCVFVVDDTTDIPIIQTKKYDKHMDLINAARSKYLPVSHRVGIEYIINNPEKRVVFVGVGCALQAIINVITIKNLNKEKYLFIGLFCDKTMHYGVVEYFSQHPLNRGRKLKNLVFRSKQSGGWPGNVRLLYTDGSFSDLPNTERGAVKDYFMPERCMYCLDKLNRNCDIAVGDNYIKENADDKGVSSILIRTDKGEDVWNLTKSLFKYDYDSSDKLLVSQVIWEKKRNYSFACIKGIYNKVDKTNSKDRKDYKRLMRKITIGLNDASYNKIHKDIKIQSALSKAKKPLRFVYYRFHK